MPKGLKSIIYDIMFIANILFAQSCDDSISIKPTVVYNKFKNVLPPVKTTPKTTPIITLPQITLLPIKTKSIMSNLPTPPPTPPPIPIPIPTTTIIQSIQPIQTPVSNIVEYTFKSNDIQSILNKHNDERQLNNLTDFIWNDNLKYTSQLWSNTLAKNNCILEHKLFSASQNLYAGYGWIEPNLSNAVQAWLDEKNILNKPNVTFNEIGHYLIIINTSLKEVGCASSINIANNCFVVTCNYN